MRGQIVTGSQSASRVCREIGDERRQVASEITVCERTQRLLGLWVHGYRERLGRSAPTALLTIHADMIVHGDRLGGFVVDILIDACVEPEPKRRRKRPWKQFVTTHWETRCRPPRRGRRLRAFELARAATGPQRPPTCRGLVPPSLAQALAPSGTRE